MSLLIVDGVESTVPVAPDALFSELVDRLRSDAQASKRVLSRISVNGIEIDERDAIDLATLPVGEIDVVEVECRSAREIAYDTLVNLDAYAAQLSTQARDCRDGEGFRRLVDGLEVFVEAVQQVREALNSGPIEAADQQENRLAALLQRTFDSLGSDGVPSDSRILNEEFPAHMAGWTGSAFPAIRALFSS